MRLVSTQRERLIDEAARLTRMRATQMSGTAAYERLSEEIDRVLEQSGG